MYKLVVVPFTSPHHDHHHHHHHHLSVRGICF